MAVALEELYQEIEPLYDIRLVTESCFHKIIEWTHIVENPEFIKLLHGNELIFNPKEGLIPRSLLRNKLMTNEVSLGLIPRSLLRGVSLPDCSLIPTNGCWILCGV